MNNNTCIKCDNGTYSDGYDECLKLDYIFTTDSTYDGECSQENGYYSLTINGNFIENFEPLNDLDFELETEIEHQKINCNLMKIAKKLQCKSTLSNETLYIKTTNSYFKNSIIIEKNSKKLLLKNMPSQILTTKKTCPCPIGQYLYIPPKQKNNFSCQNCPSNCINCSSAANCDECKYNYGKIGNICKNCLQILNMENCELCNFTGNNPHCTQCFGGKKPEDDSENACANKKEDYYKEIMSMLFRFDKPSINKNKFSFISRFISMNYIVNYAFNLLINIFYEINKEYYQLQKQMRYVFKLI